MMTKYISNAGIDKLQQFLRDYHRRGDEMFESHFNAWAWTALDNLADDGNAYIEIRSIDSRLGRAQILDLDEYVIDQPEHDLSEPS